MTQLPDLGVLDARLNGLQRPAASGATTGLCRAIADRYGIDPLVVRLAFVALTFFGGLGVVLYLWGTLLTPRVGHRTPILALIPSFGQWTRPAQWALVIFSSLLLFAPLAFLGGPPLIPIVLLVLVVWLVRRGRRTRTGTPGAPTTPTTSGMAPDATGDPTPMTVAEWRQRTAHYAAARPGSPEALPVVDLYNPSPATTAVAAAPAPARPVSWLGALIVVALAAAAGVFVPLVAGVSHLPLGAPVAVCATLGVTMLAWALLVRSRRLPTVLLVLAILGGAATGAVAHHLATPVPAPAAEAEAEVVAPIFVDGEVTEHEFFATDAVLDLTDVPLDVATTIQVNALASDVTIVLPGVPAEIIRNDTASDVSIARAGEDIPQGLFTLELDIMASDISVEFAS